jgi:formate hydrogenlyase transcriptional activator
MPSFQSSVKGLAIAERYRTLLEINNAIITNLTQQALLHAISEALHRVISFDRCAITLYQPGKDTFRFLAVEGDRLSDYFATGLEVERSETCISWVFDHQQPLLRRNLEEERQYANEHRLASEGMQSLCVLPLVFQGKCVGTLSFVSQERDRYSNEDAAFLQEVANQVALAVSNMTSYEEIAALNTRVELTAARYRTLLEVNNAIVSHLTQEDLLHSISAILRRFLPLDGASITLYNQKNDTFHYFSMENTNLSNDLRHGAQFSRENSVSAWVFDHQRPVVRRDLAKEQHYSNDRRLVEIGIASDCIVPMIVAGKSIGTLNVGSKKKDQYSEAETALLQEVANQVALAVTNMISYEEIAALSARVEHTAERYRKVLEVNNAIVTHLNRGDLMHSIAEILHRFLPFDGAVITFYVPESDVFRSFALETMISTDYLRAGMEIPRKESMVTEVFENQRGRIRRDLEKEQRFTNDHRLLELGIVSDCIVPLIVGGKSIGTIGIGSRQKSQYSEDDMELLQEVANQVALAVANMVSYEEIERLKARLEKENVYLQEEIRTDHNFEEITGNSPALLAVLRKVEQVAPTDSTVLIHGETGTGKELIARAIHDRSDRKSRPLVKVNCSAISAGLVESELFGHVKGAFTGALERHIGRFELADGGTIFLDEIGELPLATQVKLLRVLQEREFEPVGSNKPVLVDVRVIAATNRNLQESIQTGTFRSDLFYRLNVFPIEVPPLSERRSDIPQLAMFFLARFAKKFGKNIRSIPRETIDRLSSYSWPGNIRELQNVIERAAILSHSSVLELEPDLIPELAPSEPSSVTEKSAEALQDENLDPATPATLEEMERAHIVAILNQTGGVVEGPRGAARILGLHPNTLRHRIQKLGLKRASYHPS